MLSAKDDWLDYHCNLLALDRFGTDYENLSDEDQTDVYNYCLTEYEAQRVQAQMDTHKESGY